VKSTWLAKKRGGHDALIAIRGHMGPAARRLDASEASDRVTRSRDRFVVTSSARAGPYGRGSRSTHRVRHVFRQPSRFTYSGDLKVFADEEQIAALERQMADRGYLDSSKMANSFNLLRSNDLIWPYVINNYFRGKEPLPFDLLYWNADATRMPAANHSFYLRNCYLDNKLARGEMVIGGEKLDLKSIKLPSTISPPARTTSRRRICAARLEILRRTGQVRARRLGPHRRHRQPAGPAEVPILDRGQAHQRQPRAMAGQGGRASGLLVAGLVRVAHGAKRCAGARPYSGRRPDRADRGRAGKLCEGQG